MESDDQYWRQPSQAPAPDAGAVPVPASPAAAPWPFIGYQGPPPTSVPPAEWRPQLVVQPAPPRRLPAQDHGAIDEDEARARTLTRGLAMLAAALILVVLCSLCGRALF